MKHFVKSLLLVIFPLLIFSQSIIASGTVVINEFSAVTAGTTVDPDWVELYNQTDDPLDLNNWILRDSTETNKVNLNGWICPNGFRKFNFSNRLNNGGDTIRLVNSLDSLEDSVTYFSDMIPQHASGQSTSRIPDGSTTWVVLTQPTPQDEECNPSTTPTLTLTPTNTPTETPSPTPSATPTLLPSPTPTASPEPTITVEPTIPSIPTPTPSIYQKPFLNWWKNFWQRLNRIIPIFPL